MRQKVGIILIVLLLVCQSFVGLTPVAYAEGAVITENLITDVTILDQDGNRIEDIRPEQGSRVKINYEWSLPVDHKYSAGATFTFALPNKFKLDKSLTGELKGEVGTYEVTPEGTVTFTFNDEINDGTSLDGYFEVWREFDESKFEGGLKQPIVFPIHEGQKVILVHFKNKGSEMDKTGVANKVINPSEIYWDVDFNKDENSITEATFEDKLPVGLAIDLNSIKVYSLQVNLDGSVQEGNPVDIGTSQIIKTDTGFKVNFGNIESAYRVKYTTSITDVIDQTFTNEATVSGTDIQPMTETASVTVKFSKPLEKASIGYEPTSQTITWAIQYNYNEQVIPKKDAWLVDQFDTTQELILDSLAVYQMTIDENGEARRGDLEPNKNYTVESTTAGFRLEFKQDVSSAYEITYQTKAIKRVHEDSYTVNNKVEMHDGTSKEATQNINQVIFHKRAKSVDYANKIITWEIHLNQDKKSMENVVITDNFAGQNFKLVEESVSISDLVKGTEYKVEINPSSDPNSRYDDGLTITFLKEPITTSHVITYQTTFDPRQPIPNDGYKNQATLKWNEGGTTQTPIQKSTQVDPDHYTTHNGNKTGIYNAQTKEITWTIDVNYNLHQLDKAIIRDFYTDKQALVEDSLTVHHLKLTGKRNGVELGELVSNTDYEFKTMKDANGNAGFEIQLGQIDSAYRITYKTSLAGQPILASYHNQATLQDGTEKPVFSQSASVAPKYGGEYLNKSGRQGEGADSEFAFWTIDINRSQSQLDAGTTVVDILSENQILIQESIKLYGTAVNPNGTLVKLDLVSPSEYTLEASNQQLTLVFKNAIDRAYILEYQSFINAEHGEKINNDVRLSGQSSGEVDQNTKNEFSVYLYGAEGGANTPGKGKFKIVKVDEATNQPLAGATFGLYDKSGSILLETLVTDKNGEAESNTFKFKNYLLKELSAPSGYAIADEYKAGKVITLAEADQIFTISNKQLHQAVELTKMDSNDMRVLSGAEFALQKKDETGLVTVSTHITDTNGRIVVDGLEAGQYQFVETKAPEHYLLDPTPVEFAIQHEQTEVVKVDKRNERGRGHLIITKVDAYNAQKVLPGAEFELYDNKGTLLATKTTDADGKIVFEDLPYDHYHLKETKAPRGYVITSATSTIFVTMDHPTKELTIQNRKTSITEPSNPDKPEKPIDPEKPMDPEKPIEPDQPVDPAQPEEPSNPDDPKQPDDSGNPDDPKQSRPGESDHSDEPNQMDESSNSHLSDHAIGTLPQTGEKARVDFLLAGAFFLIIGAWMLMHRKKVKE
ncbi:collagen binding domain-containing protein [Rubeoparvulum massiliense]|uniref:collagen binding domain-containing protein n=1 Tax=Rubeoparvulum massiliense TaxID=1631346 RepID=UPI00065E0B3C|nr:collagen binding domain-containing protein [Rubeoparvulum massiliense]